MFYICLLNKKTQRSQMQANFKTLFITILILVSAAISKATPIKDMLSGYEANHAADLQVQTLKDGEIRKVVIDAGHGGHDGGCHGKHHNEKDLALKMALKLGALISENFPDIEVIYTRTKDVFIPLHERIGLANKKDADLFISIHCNWISNPKTKGTETFVMGLHRAVDNLEVAKRENSSILLESDFDKNYEGYDPNSPVGHIMLTMYQDAYLSQSIEFASHVESSLKNLNFTTSRGVKQAGFAVLRRATMPSVLIETGFLSNADEEAYLGSDAGQSEVAMSIFKAFSKIKTGKSGNEKPIAASPKPTNNEVAVAQIDVKSQSTLDQKHDNQPITNLGSNIENTSMRIQEVVATKYRVQIAALKRDIKKELEGNKKITQLGQVIVFQKDDLYKYQIGDFDSLIAASKVKEQLVALGYTNAFLTTGP